MVGWAMRGGAVVAGSPEASPPADNLGEGGPRSGAHFRCAPVRSRGFAPPLLWARGTPQWRSLPLRSSSLTGLCASIALGGGDPAVALTSAALQFAHGLRPSIALGGGTPQWRSLPLRSSSLTGLCASIALGGGDPAVALTSAALQFAHGLRPMKKDRSKISYVRAQRNFASVLFRTAHCLRGHYLTTTNFYQLVFCINIWNLLLFRYFSPDSVRFRRVRFRV